MGNLWQNIKAWITLHSPARLWVIVEVARKNGYRQGYAAGYSAANLHQAAREESVR